SAPDNRNQTYFTVPAVDLAVGDALVIHLRDEDGILGGDRLGRVEWVYDGTLPLQVENEDFNLSCTFLEQEAVNLAGAEAILLAEANMAEARNAIAPDPNERDFGAFDVRFDRRRGEVLQAAAWLGFEHGDVTRLLNQYDGLQEAWDGAVNGMLREIYDALPPLGEVSHLV
ncbi:MAG: hypothetical protein KC561_21930, partial [Myxococcales bacterium]|nr:hypothetical protein [Myxococcales bacterium]